MPQARKGPTVGDKAMSSLRPEILPTHTQDEIKLSFDVQEGREAVEGARREDGEVGEEKLPFAHEEACVSERGVVSNCIAAA